MALFFRENGSTGARALHFAASARLDSTHCRPPFYQLWLGEMSLNNHTVLPVDGGQPTGRSPNSLSITRPYLGGGHLDVCKYLLSTGVGD